MKLREIYRDVNSYIASYNVERERFFHYDIIKAINDAISQQIISYLSNGGDASAMLETTTVYFSIESMEFPDLFYIDLERPIIQEVPSEYKIYQSVFWRAKNRLQDSKQSWKKGDLAIKGAYYYECLKDVSSKNTYDKTFVDEKIRNFNKNNDLRYIEGDKLYDGTNYWRVNTTFTNTYDKDVQQISELDELVWKRKGRAFFTGKIVPFRYLSELRLSMDFDNYYPFSIKDNTLYSVVSDKPFTISYVPEWETVEDLDTELHLPYSLIPSIKSLSKRMLVQKIGEKIEKVIDESESED